MELTADNLTLLKTVNSNTFSPLKNLRVLRLSNCPQLQEIDREAFDEHPLLREVNATLLLWSFKNNLGIILGLP